MSYPPPHTITPAKLLRITLLSLLEAESYGLDDGWQDYPYRWRGTIDVVPQQHGSNATATPYMYTADDINVGDYVVTNGNGRILKVVEILLNLSTHKIVCTLEDENRTNILEDGSTSGDGGIPLGDGFLFEVKNGWPILHPIPNALAHLLPPYFASDILSRFLAVRPPDVFTGVSSATGINPITPTEFRIETTSNGTGWDTTTSWGLLSFYSNDASAYGPQIQAAIGATAFDAAGGTANLVFKTWDGVGLTDRLTIDRNGKVYFNTVVAARADDTYKYQFSAGKDTRLLVGTGSNLGDSVCGVEFQDRLGGVDVPHNYGQITGFVRCIRNGSNADFKLALGAAYTTNLDAQENVVIRGSATGGKLGVNIEPAAPLHVYPAANGEAIRVWNSGGISSIGGGYSALTQNAYSFGEPFKFKRLTANASVGVGVITAARSPLNTNTGGVWVTAGGTDVNAEINWADMTPAITWSGSGEICIGHETPSMGDIDLSVKPLLHVKKSGNTGATNWLARFQAGADADYTSAGIVLNHDNDRGIFIEGGRQFGNTAFGGIGLINNIGLKIDALTLREDSANQSFFFGVGRASPQYKLDVAGTVRTAAGTATKVALHGETGGDDTGIFYPENDSWAVSVGGIQRLTATPTGNIVVNKRVSGFYDEDMLSDGNKSVWTMARIAGRVVNRDTQFARDPNVPSVYYRYNNVHGVRRYIMVNVAPASSGSGNSYYMGVIRSYSAGFGSPPATIFGVEANYTPVTDKLVENPTIHAFEIRYYRFDLLDASNTGKPLEFSLTPTGPELVLGDPNNAWLTHYTKTGTPGTAGSFVELRVVAGVNGQSLPAEIYYRCPTDPTLFGTITLREEVLSFEYGDRDDDPELAYVPNSTGRALRLKYKGDPHAYIGEYPVAEDPKYIMYNLGTSPGLGGFYIALRTSFYNHPTDNTFGYNPAIWDHTQYRERARFLFRFVAKIPVGYALAFASNRLGTGAKYYALTSNLGTGDWTEYVFYVQTGTGDRSTTAYFYLYNASLTAADFWFTPFNWYVAVFEAIDLDAPTNAHDYLKVGYDGYFNEITAGFGSISASGNLLIGGDGEISGSCVSKRLKATGTSSLQPFTITSANNQPAAGTLDLDVSLENPALGVGHNDTGLTRLPSVVLCPSGGTFQSNINDIEGKLKITLPTTAATNSMLQFKIDIYEWLTGGQSRQTTLTISGYWWNGTSSTSTNYGYRWRECTACVDQTTATAPTYENASWKVHYGYDGHPCIWIERGHLNSIDWGYTIVRVRDVLCGWNSGNLATWLEGWAISFTTETPYNKNYDDNPGQSVTAAIPIVFSIDLVKPVTASTDGNIVTHDLTVRGIKESVKSYGNMTGTVNLATDITTASVFTGTLVGNTTFLFPSAVAGRSFTLVLNQNTSFAITWPANVQWPNAAAPSLATSRYYIFSFLSFDGVNWLGAISDSY